MACIIVACISLKIVICPEIALLARGNIMEVVKGLWKLLHPPELMVLINCDLDSCGLDNLKQFISWNMFNFKNGFFQLTSCSVCILFVFILVNLLVNQKFHLFSFFYLVILSPNICVRVAFPKR